ncbi:MAG: NTP transferase domain-containing protein [Rickettsiaceae bacterium]|nr:NTP transferase domain-containing protein [Rickettsiaceae bacterium]
MEKQIIILAAGKGSRMKSDLPKVMHRVGSQTMLQRVIESCRQVSDDLILVYSDNLKPFIAEYKNVCKFAKQEHLMGTASAVAAAKDLIDPKKHIGVIYADNPLISSDIINNLFNHLIKSKSDLITLAFECKPPNQYGRIIVNDQGEFVKIIEAKFANSKEEQITLCNSGIMAFTPGTLTKYLPQILQVNYDLPNRELYLTDIIEVCYKAGMKATYYKASKAELVVGVNTQEELRNANDILANF